MYLSNKMLELILSPIFVGLVVAAISTSLSFYFSNKLKYKEIENQKKIEYLIQAFRYLLLASNNPDANEKAISMREANILIQCFGSINQIDLLNKIYDNWGAKKVGEFDPLINSIREDLRGMLKMEKYDENARWVHPIKK